MTRIMLIEKWLATFPCEEFFKREDGKSKPGDCIYDHIDAQDILKQLSGEAGEGQ